MSDEANGGTESYFYELSRDLGLSYMVPFYITILLSPSFGGSSLKDMFKFHNPRDKALHDLALKLCPPAASTSTHSLFGFPQNGCYLSFKVQVKLHSLALGWIFLRLSGWVKHSAHL